MPADWHMHVVTSLLGSLQVSASGLTFSQDLDDTLGRPGDVQTL